MNIKSAIIGLGKIGVGYDVRKNEKSYLTHASSLKNHKNFKLVGAVDINLNKRLRFQKKYKIKAYKSINELLKNKDLTFVVVANNFSNNVKIFEKIAKKKSVKFILYEKPFIKNIFEAKKVSNLSKKYKVKYAVNFQRSFNKKYIQIINKIKSPKKNNHLNIITFYSIIFSNMETVPCRGIE